MNIFNKGDKFMMFFKYTLLFFIFSFCALIGNLISKKYKNRVTELKSFKEVFSIIESKISFTYEPIGDIFDEIPILIKDNSINNIFIEAKNNLKRFELKKSWSDAIDNNRNKLNLKIEDINTIKSFGNMLRKNRFTGTIK